MHPPSRPGLPARPAGGADAGGYSDHLPGGCHERPRGGLLPVYQVRRGQGSWLEMIKKSESELQYGRTMISILHSNINHVFQCVGVCLANLSRCCIYSNYQYQHISSQIIRIVLW